MKTVTTLTAAALFGLTSLSVQAHSHKHKHYDTARVVEVTPIIEQVRHERPVKHCRPQHRVQYNRHNASYTDEIVGAIIGGAIGNATGSNKSNKKVQAALGAALGASIAHDLNQSNHTRHYNNDRHCQTLHNVEYHERVTGYRVSYKYHGFIYHTRTQHHPGKRIKVKVHVEPAY